MLIINVATASVRKGDAALGPFPTRPDPTEIRKRKRRRAESGVRATFSPKIQRWYPGLIFAWYLGSTHTLYLM